MLRPLVEAAPDGAALACYPEEGAALEATIRSALAAEGAGVEPDAVQFLAAQLGSDRSGCGAGRCRRSCRAVAG